MFASDSKLFSIGMIILPLKNLNTIVMNIIQLEIIIKTIDSRT
jgi:hypothetical protein